MSYVETLDGLDIEFGRKLWQSLRNNTEFPIQGTFWLLEPEAGEWLLVIASPKVDALGPRDAYRELAALTENIPANSRQLLKIKLISPRDPMYEALRSFFAQTASVEGARLGNTMVGGMLIGEAYLYEIR
ncbi:MAG: hypothetical protein ACLQVG_33160 [Terriglobia bacterium]